MANERDLGRTDLTFIDTSPSMRARMLDETSWGRELGWEMVRVISAYMSVYEIMMSHICYANLTDEKEFEARHVFWMDAAAGKSHKIQG